MKRNSPSQKRGGKAWKGIRGRGTVRVEAERFVNGKRRRDRVWMEQEMEVGVVPSVKPPE